jgi:uncharacterized protein (UPF0335 family)
MAEIGHNSHADVITSEASSQLKSFVERIERLNEDKSAIQGDLKELFSEIKSVGFDTKILRKVIRIRAMDASKRSEEETLVGLYMSAL